MRNARWVAWKMKPKEDQRVRVYRCGYCGGYHIGH